MASLSDHTRRDAEHAMRSAIQVEIGKYVRRMQELGKGHIKEAIENAAREGRVIDGTELGRDAALDSIRTYIGGGEPRPAIDAANASELGDGNGSAS